MRTARLAVRAWPCALPRLRAALAGSALHQADACILRRSLRRRAVCAEGLYIHAMQSMHGTDDFPVDTRLREHGQRAHTGIDPRRKGF